ncbi:MAG: aldose epimerase [Cyanosarcina radialis HA8281-LM2]|nr:aldose epimerase [Cyanosarcina radialis HA8281-LM2]
MFAIASHQNQYQSYTLSDRQAHSWLEVVPERGGIVTSWGIRGQEILYLDAERFAQPNLSVRGGIPILFPICGNLPDNAYTYQDRVYSLKQHGFARDLPWEVTEEVTQDLAGLTLVLNTNDRTREVYPFDFKLAFTYQIQGDTLNIEQTYTNLSDTAMPFSTGLHPYFQTTDKTKLQFEIPSSEYQDQRSQAVHQFDGSFDFESDEIDVIFRQLSGNSATVTDISRHLRLTLSYDRTYSTLVFWTVKGKDYYCLEPWTAARNALNSGDRLLYIEPGASWQAVVRLQATFF